MANTSSLSEFYRDRSVFVTGATGFMGKVLVEKLIRSCPHIKNVYVLIRSKNQVDAKCRREQLLTSKIFGRIKNENPEALSKVITITGELLKPDFDLSDEDIETLTKNVSVVFHFAASVRFNEHLKQSVQTNLMPINFLLQLCRKMHFLVAVIHLSTAYSNCTKTFVEEIIYPSTLPPNTIIELVKNLSDDILEKITPILLGDYPNTYSFTKYLAEILINEEHGDLPVAIIRPSIVCSALQEPYAGWIDNYNHSTGVVLAIGKGLTRSFFGHVNKIIDLVPVDVCVNLVIAAARETASQSFNQVKVYNCATSSLNPITIRMYLKYVHQAIHKNPFCQMIRLPLEPQALTNKLIFSFFMMLDYITFIYPFDFILKLCQKRYTLRILFNKYWKLINVHETFLTTEWVFSTENMIELWSSLTLEDRKIFFFDVRGIDWSIFFQNSVLGIKQYLLKESLETIPSAKKHYNKLFWTHYTVKYIKWILCFYLFIIWKRKIILDFYLISKIFATLVPSIVNQTPKQNQTFVKIFD